MMKHTERGGQSRQSTTTEISADGLDTEKHGRGRHGRGGRRGMRGAGHGGHHRGGRSGRLFDYGELRLLVLALIADEPRHGYELIKAIEDRFGGSYTPSPGVIYPTLSWLSDMAYADVTLEEGRRKRYAISAEGQAFLADNQAVADALLARSADDVTEGRHRGGAPAPVMRAMENLKMALRLRLRGGEVTDEVLHQIAAVIDTAAQGVERA